MKTLAKLQITPIRLIQKKINLFYIKSENFRIKFKIQLIKNKRESFEYKPYSPTLNSLMEVI